MGAKVLHVIANGDASAFYRVVGFIETGMTHTALKPGRKMELQLD
jgi:hypothetical protein